jgi:hemerythrin-like domain-containing protein
MSHDAIVQLKEDHQEVRKVFRDFQQAGDNATKRKGELVDKMIELLTVHTYIENEVMYPRVRELLPDLEDDVLESYEEHHVADVLVIELAAMKPTDERFDAKTTVLIENVTHHIEEEEQEWFPKVREGLGRKALQEIGDELLAAREKAPTRTRASACSATSRGCSTPSAATPRCAGRRVTEICAHPAPARSSVVSATSGGSATARSSSTAMSSPRRCATTTSGATG